MDASYGRRDTATMLLSALSGWYRSGPDRKTALKRKFTRFRKVRAACFLQVNKITLGMQREPVNYFTIYSTLFL